MSTDKGTVPTNKTRLLDDNEHDAPPPYSNIKSDQSPAYQKFKAHPALRDPHHSLSQAMQVHRLEDSRPQVFDRTMRQFSFSKYKDLIDQTKPGISDVLNLKIFENGEGRILTIVERKENGYQMITQLKVTASTMDELSHRSLKHRVQETTTSPCPHLYKWWTRQLRLFYLIGVDQLSAWFSDERLPEDNYFRLCEYCGTAAGSMLSSGKVGTEQFVAELFVVHDLGPLHGPDDEEWVRLSTVDPYALRHKPRPWRPAKTQSKPSACILM